MKENNQITDSGKVWVKGSFGPAHAVLVGGTVVLTGIIDGQSWDTFVTDNLLFIDITDENKTQRIARIISLTAEPTIAGTLFSGFENTKHRDIMAIDYKTATDIERVEKGEDFNKVSGLNSEEFLDYIKGQET